MKKNSRVTTIRSESNSLRVNKDGEVIGSNINTSSSVITSRFSASNSLGKSVIFYIFAWCFFVSLFWRITGSDNIFTFTSLLEAFSSAPSIPTSWITSFVSNKIVADWGVFEFLRNFLNSFVMPLLGTVSFVAVGVAQIITYATWILGTLFGVV